MSEIIKRKFMINRLNFLLYVRLQHHDKKKYIKAAAEGKLMKIFR